jgi:hypothetical protein
MSAQDQPSSIEIQIEGSVSGDLEITGQYVIIRIGGDVEGSVTVKQEALANPHDVLVEVGGERLHPEDRG